ncbi:DUF5597 domain-containing protein [Gluconobacter morbifer]|nr:DUF5597 domain-containing protein [Gluconobacter morbifer]
MPHIIGKDGHFHLEIDGKPFFVLAAQMHNSSAFSSSLPAFWNTADRLHINTVQAPVYWETFEPSPGRYDFSMVNQLIDGARTHHVRLILLWFGTWKNGAGHYVPLWIKRNPQIYPRLENADHLPLDGMSPFGEQTLACDKAAFKALMTHLRERDADRHTVIMVQVENEPGLLGTVRDHTTTADRAFDAPVPADVLSVTKQLRHGNWSAIFGSQAPEIFSAWAVSRYINQVAEAGRAVYPLPLYVNAWLHYRGLKDAGTDFPSGGATYDMLNIWKSQSPAISIIGTDSYTNNLEQFHGGVLPYQRKDNAPWLSESGITVPNARWTYDLIARGGIGASVFGVDDPDHDEAIATHGLDNILLTPLVPTLVMAASSGNVAALLEERGRPSPTHIFGNWMVRAAFGASWGLPDPTESPFDSQETGRALVVRLDDTHFLVAGTNARINFLSQNHDGGIHEVVRVEEGTYDAHDKWHAERIWNGDETDYGMSLPAKNGTALQVEVLDIPSNSQRHTMSP